MFTRRGFVTCLMSVIAAPAVVRVTSIMPVKAMPAPQVLDELIGIIEDEKIGGVFHPGKWKLFGVPTRKFNTFDWDRDYDPVTWRTFRGSWSAAKEKGLQGTSYRVERDQ